MTRLENRTAYCVTCGGPIFAGQLLTPISFLLTSQGRRRQRTAMALDLSPNHSSAHPDDGPILEIAAINAGWPILRSVLGDGATYIYRTCDRGFHSVWGFFLVYYPLHSECLTIAKRVIDYSLNYGTQGVTSMEELLKLYRQRHLDTKLDSERRPLPPRCALYEPHGAVGWQENA